MKNPDPPTSIPAPTADEKPFQIGDELTVYEAAMVYAGRHPYPHGFGPYDSRNKRERCLTLLKLGLSERLPRRQRAQRSWDIFCELGDPVRRRGPWGVRALGAWMQVGDQRFDGDDIRRLYESDDFPLQRRLSE